MFSCLLKIIQNQSVSILNLTLGKSFFILLIPEPIFSINSVLCKQPAKIGFLNILTFPKSFGLKRSLPGFNIFSI